MTDCNHKWVSNAGWGGSPKFNERTSDTFEKVMAVQCERCGERIYVTESQWSALPVDPEDEQEEA